MNVDEFLDMAEAMVLVTTPTPALHAALKEEANRIFYNSKERDHSFPVMILALLHNGKPDEALCEYMWWRIDLTYDGDARFVDGTYHRVKLSQTARGARL